MSDDLSAQLAKLGEDLKLLSNKFYAVGETAETLLVDLKVVAASLREKFNVSTVAEAEALKDALQEEIQSDVARLTDWLDEIGRLNDKS